MTTTLSIWKQNKINGNIEVILNRTPSLEDAVKAFEDVKNDDTDIKIKLIVNKSGARGYQYALRTK